MDAITDALQKGHTQVIDADLSKYFDTIVHKNLMKTVAVRIVDKRILAILNLWLKAHAQENIFHSLSRRPNL
ncbi:MAG: hypothetical protein GY775_06495 [Candidatus Scalindua sp.]|nr:hypothetical protein [Candidatus Scalindua sp.]